MILNHKARTISQDGVTWTPSYAQWLLVAALARRPGVVRTRQELLDEIGASFSGLRSIDTQVKNIRKAWAGLGWPNVITTRRDVGYVWEKQTMEPTIEELQARRNLLLLNDEQLIHMRRLKEARDAWLALLSEIGVPEQVLAAHHGNVAMLLAAEHVANRSAKSSQ